MARLHITRPMSPLIDRDGIVHALTDFYKLLVRMYLPESALKFPPPGGWPNITAGTMADSGKSAHVIDVLKHLPYIDDELNHQMMTHIEYKCDVIDYSKYTAEDFASWTKSQPFPGSKGEMGIRYQIENAVRRAADEPEEEEKEEEDDEGPDHPIPADIPNLIVIAQGYESGGVNIVLDVINSLVYKDVIRMDFHGPFDFLEWFDEFSTNFETLRLVPILSGDGGDGDMLELRGEGDDDPEAIEYKNIYLKHGWPGENYDKERALAAVERLRIEKEEEEAQRMA